MRVRVTLEPEQMVEAFSEYIRKKLPLDFDCVDISFDGSGLEAIGSVKDADQPRETERPETKPAEPPKENPAPAPYFHKIDVTRLMDFSGLEARTYFKSPRAALSKKDAKDLVTMLFEGASWDDASRHFKIGKDTLYRVVRMLGIKPRSIARMRKSSETAEIRFQGIGPPGRPRQPES